MVGPPGSPIIVIYRGGKYLLKLETEQTSESLGCTLAWLLKSLNCRVVAALLLVSFKKSQKPDQIVTGKDCLPFGHHL